MVLVLGKVQHMVVDSVMVLPVGNDTQFGMVLHVVQDRLLVLGRVLVLSVVQGMDNEVLNVVLGVDNEVLNVVLGVDNEVLSVVLGVDNEVLSVVLGMDNKVLSV